MALIPWPSKAEHGEKVTGDEEIECAVITAEDYDGVLLDFEWTPDFSCQDCLASRSGICPFHAEIPRLP